MLQTLTLEARDIVELPAGVKHREAAPATFFTLSACAGGKCSSMQDIVEGTHFLESLATAAAKEELRHDKLELLATWDACPHDQHLGEETECTFLV